MPTAASRTIWTGSATAPPPSVARPSSPDGMAMNLRHLDGLLASHGVVAIEALGQAFDPHVMQAVDIAHHPERPAGIVVGVARAGFIREGRALRPADVIVNKKD